MIRIERVNEQQLARIKEISDLRFGVNYLSLSSLRNYLNCPDTGFFAATDEDRVLGFALFVQCDFESLVEMIGSKYRKSLEPLREHEIFILRKTTAVHPNFENLGVGYMLASEGIRHYGRIRPLFISLSWKRKNTIPMENISSRLGYRFFRELEQYWKEESVAAGYSCPECGSPPCTCNAVLLVK